LIDVDFGENGRDFFLSDDLVQIIREIVHYYVEVLFLSLSGEIALLHLQIIGVF
jgi:hypothetical protein